MTLMPSANIIVFTHPVDSHAAAVDYVLRHHGHRPVLFDTSRVSQGDYISVEYRDTPWVSVGDYAGDIDGITSSWNRRITRQKVLPSFSHPADADLIRDTSNAVLSGMLGLLDERFPVNPITSVKVSSNKLTQLRAARDVGFQIPRTLVSNKFDDIREFARQPGEICMKGYYAQGWLTDGGIRHAITTRLAPEDLNDPAPCEIMAHIYQTYIVKKREYRLTLFAGHACAVAINSNKLEGSAESDWRANLSYLEHIEAAVLPDDVISAARRLLARLGLRFGTMDIAETVDGDFVFFEVNEQGQWLWTEHHCPDRVLLQPFCEYLACADDKYVWNPRRRSAELSATEVFKILKSESRYDSLLSAGQIPREGKLEDERTATVATSSDAYSSVMT